MSRREMAPPAEGSERRKPRCTGLSSCAEEDSNLHPLSVDQALNLVTRVSDPSYACISSKSSAVLDTMDGLDVLDVAGEVATADWLLTTSDPEHGGAKAIARAISEPQAARALAAVEDDRADPSAAEGSKAGRLPVSRAARDPELRLGVVVRCCAGRARGACARIGGRGRGCAKRDGDDHWAGRGAGERPGPSRGSGSPRSHVFPCSAARMAVASSMNDHGVRDPRTPRGP